MKSSTAILVAAALVAILAAARAEQPRTNSQPILLAAADQSTTTEGEIRKVDKDTKKLTIKHGELRNLDMPAMTMVFQVKDPAMLEQVKAGDKVKFRADKVNGAFTVMEIEVVK